MSAPIDVKASTGAPSVPAFKAVLKEKGKAVDPAIVDRSLTRPLGPRFPLPTIAG